MGERGTVRGALITGEEPMRAERGVKRATKGDEGYLALRDPERMRYFLQTVVVQRFREKHVGRALPLARNLIGLVFEDGYGQFADVPPPGILDIRSETALVTAWLAAQTDDTPLFRLALDAIRRQDGKVEHALTRLYRGHIECIGVDKLGSEMGNAAPLSYRPDSVYQNLKGAFSGLKPLANVARAITVRHVVCLLETADGLDAMAPDRNITLFEWLEQLSNEVLDNDLRRDDGFFVGSVALLEAAGRFLKKAIDVGDEAGARRCYDRACAAYATLLVISRRGAPALHMSPNAQDLLDQADRIMLRVRSAMKSFDRGIPI